MVKVGIVGASGYTGEGLNKILSRHTKAKVVSLTATYARKNFNIKAFDIDEVIHTCDLVFFALPHGESMKFIPQMLKAGKKVIDLGADYRLKNVSEYEEWYKVKHLDKKNIATSIYGLPEVYRQTIKKTNFVANPGCYPTAVILSLFPLLKKKLVKSKPIIIDAKSGLSGAGKKSIESGLAEELKDNFRPYKVNHHQHMPEINQELSRLTGKKITVNFVPHLIPVFRGILTTTYLEVVQRLNLCEDKLIDLYKKFYKHEPFIRILDKGVTPQIKDVIETNFCNIGIFFNKQTNMIVIVSSIDNLIKGAAGQAVQNMNLMYGFNEKEALI